MNNPNYQYRMGKEREIINFPLQGSAADLMKIAMIKVSDYLVKLNNKNIKMVLQVHDELIFEVPENLEKIEQFINDIKALMMNVYKLDIPLNVESNYARRWGDLK